MGTGISFSAAAFDSLQQARLVEAAVRPPEGGAAKALGFGKAGSAGDSFSLAEAATEAAAYDGGVGRSSGGASAEQLSFSFLQEVRSVELQQFSARFTDGQTGSTRLVEASRAVAARFEISASVSGVVLDGFSKGAEALPDEVSEQLATLTERLLQEADEILNEAFELLNGFFSGEYGLGELQERFDQFARDIQEAFAGFNAPVAEGGAQQSSVQLEFNFSLSVSVTEEVTVQQSDPLVLDLDGDGVELTRHDNGARFDIRGNGQAVNTAFVTGGDAFLAIDRNGNGRIDDGTELFGDQRGAANGFEALREFDSNGDGRIDRGDAGYNQLLLFRDNGNGRTERGELITLAEAGVEAIDLTYRNVDEKASGGNRIAQIGRFERTNGAFGTAADALLNFTV